MRVPGSLRLSGLALLLGSFVTSGAALAAGATTTLGTRGGASQPNPPITSNAGAGWGIYARDPDYPNMLQLPLQFITLKSGRKLGVYVSVPADAQGKAVAGQFPVILTQTYYRIGLGRLIGSILPIDNTMLIGGADQFMVRRGYVTVSVDVLGSGVSDGEESFWGPLEQEAYGETVDWVTQQPWSDGAVGLAGTSALGITAMQTAGQANPAVKAVFVEVPMGDPVRGVIGIGGLINAYFLSIWGPLTEQLSVDNAVAEALYPQYAQQIAAATQQHVADLNDFYLPTVNNALNGVPGYATDDGTFWSVRSPVEKAAQIQAPTFIIGGSYDLFQRDEPLLYEQIKRNTQTKLIIDPGAHVEAITNAALDYNHAPNNGAPSDVTLFLQWFDQYLKGKSTGADKLPNVTQYVAGLGGTGAYRFASTTDWPHPQAAPQRLYLHGDLSLSAQTPGVEATHSVAEPQAATVSVWASGPSLFAWFTPHDSSVCSIGGVQWSLGAAGLLPLPCYHDDSTVENAQHAVSYQTPALTAPLYINGPIEADVWLSTTATQAALSVRVDDVAPDGTALPLSNGLMAASYRAVDTSRSRYIDGVMIQPWHPFTVASELPVVPGVPVLVPVEIFPTAALINPGHRLRVSVSASDQVEGMWTNPMKLQAAGGVSTIYNDALHPSSVVLPVVPASVLN